MSGALDTVAPLLTRAHVLGHECRRGIESFAHHLCSALALPPVTIEWSSYCGTASMSKAGEMTLADVRDDERIPRARIAKLAGFVLHELLHRKYTDWSATDHRPYVRALHNAVEDAWIERRCAREALLGNARPLLSALLHDMVREALAEVADWANPAQYPFSLAVLARGYGVAVPVPGALLPAFQRVAAQVDACQSSHDTLRLAREIFDTMQNPPPPPQQQQQEGEQGEPQEGEQGEQGEPQDGEPQQGEPCQDGEQGAEGDGEGEGEQDAEGQEGAQEGQEGAEEGQEGAQGAGKQETPEDAGAARRPHEAMQPRQVEPSPGRKGTGPGGTFTSGAMTVSQSSLYGADKWTTSLPVPARLRYEVRRLFENTAREWRDGGFKSGRLHAAALHRVALDRPEIFSRRYSQEGVESAVCILLDISSSMWPDYSNDPESIAKSKISAAVETCAMLLDCLSQAGADSMVLTFGTHTSTLKRFGQPWRQVLQTMRRLGNEGHTNDYHALRTAHDALLQHPAQRRVVLAITDGQGNISQTSEQRQAGERLGIQHLCIGIQEDASPTWGAASVMIRSPRDLATVALSRLRNV